MQLIKVSDPKSPLCFCDIIYDDYVIMDQLINLIMGGWLDGLFFRWITFTYRSHTLSWAYCIWRRESLPKLKLILGKNLD